MRSDIVNEENDSEALRKDRSQRNEATPIYQLPPDVLKVIFMFTITKCSRDQDYDRFLPSIWFNFTYVSQHWRNVALNTPRIWGVLLLNYPKWVDASLERSNEADLTVNLKLNGFSGPDPINLMAKVFESHGSRIHELCLSITDVFDDRLSSFLQNLKDDTLCLHSFQLIIINLTDIPVTFPSSEVYRRMRYLDIRSCSLPWPLCSFPNLTHLRICRVSFRPSFDEFFTSLRRMPELEVLHLTDSFPRSQPRLTMTSAEICVEPVALPRLRSLDLHSRTSFDDLADFLPFILMPSTTTINLTSTAVFYVDHLQRLVSISTFRSRDQGSISYNSLHIRCPNSGFIVEVWDNQAGISVSQILHLLWTIPMTIRPPCPLYDLITLILHMSISPEELIQRFGSLPRLRNIVVFGQTISEIIFALMHKPSNHDTLRSSCFSVTFPVLRSLSIRAIRYTSSVLPIELMLKCFMERRECNAGLDELYISHRNLHGSHVKKLREVVLDVRWDKDGSLWSKDFQHFWMSEDETESRGLNNDQD